MAKGNSGTDGRTERLFPLRFLATLVGGIGLAEVISMLVIYFVKQDTPYSLQTLVDTGIMIILIFPLLYSLSFRPLMGQIEQRKQNEARLQRVNRALRLLNHCNQVLVHAEDETRLLDKMCEILISTGGYRMAWVGFTEQSPAKKVWPVAQGGFDAGYLDLSQTAWTDTERDQEPTITAIRTGVIQVNQDFLPSPQMAPWREAALQRDYRSCIALPLKEGKTVFGVLTIYSGLPGAFNSEEVDLLEELANDLAYGIQALREQIER